MITDSRRRAAGNARTGAISSVASWTVDTLFSTGMAQCARRNSASVLVAFPEPVGRNFLPPLATDARVSAVVVCPADRPVPGWDEARVGRMLRDDYTWELPAVVARQVLFLGPRRTFTFRMARRALARGVLTLVYATPLGWRAEPIPVFILRRVVEKLLSRAS